TFLGWNTDRTASSALESLPEAKSSMTYYAIYEAIPMVYQAEYFVTVVTDDESAYLVPLSRYGGYVPAGEYSVAVNYIAVNPRSGAEYVAESFVTGTVFEPVASGMFIGIGISAFSNVVSLTPVYNIDDMAVKGLTACL
ncbi:MAG: hypothetical protein IJ856_04735, partial [Candidatus Methanomethylophilaceae archaeon]|nr:hypothetical protein [Candidatus Methanomethylophilaceae archaeon]